MCDECSREVELRTIAIRLLTADGPYFDEVVSVDTQNGGSRGEKYRRIDAMVARLARGEIYPLVDGRLQIDEPLPVRLRTDNALCGMAGHGVYRCVGKGHRRRQDCNIGRG